MVKLPDILVNKEHHGITKRIYSELKKANERERREYSNSVDEERTLRVSSIGDCPRKNWAKREVSQFYKEIGAPYRRQQPQFKDTIGGRTVSIFRMGDKVEELVNEHLLTAGYAPVRDQEEVRFDVDNDHDLVGHIDGVVSLAHEDCLLEIKSANDNQWNRCKEMGYENWNAKYAAQVHCYMAGTGLNQALVVVYNKNTSEIYCEFIKYDEDVFYESMDNARQIINVRRVPGKPNEARTKSCFYCKYCEVNEWCWGPNAELEWMD